MGGGAPGDAFVEIQVDTHKFFERDGKDIFLQLPITLPEAILGAKVTVPTIHGPVSVGVPKVVKQWHVVAPDGQGIRPRKGGDGDQYVQLKIMLPDHIDDELSSFIADWREQTTTISARKRVFRRPGHRRLTGTCYRSQS